MHGKSVGSLVCGILSIFGIGGLITAIVAIVLGCGVEKETALADPADVSKAKAGKICGIIGCVLQVISCIIVGLMVPSLIGYINAAGMY